MSLTTDAEYTEQHSAGEGSEDGKKDDGEGEGEGMEAAGLMILMIMYSKF
jgi:hypothetical protein